MLRGFPRQRHVALPGDFLLGEGDGHYGKVVGYDIGGDSDWPLATVCQCYLIYTGCILPGESFGFVFAPRF